LLILQIASALWSTARLACCVDRLFLAGCQIKARIARFGPHVLILRRAFHARAAPGRYRVDDNLETGQRTVDVVLHALGTRRGPDFCTEMFSFPHVDCGHHQVVGHHPLLAGANCSPYGVLANFSRSRRDKSSSELRGR
jgi:hypothetical protein